MKSGIKIYELNDHVSIEKLKSNNFKEGGFIRQIPSPKYSYNKFLLDDIELHIEVGINNDNKLYITNSSILVLDVDFCQPYFPFYKEECDSLYLDDVINEYNKVMYELESKQILKEKSKIKTLELAK